jgi:23S rRNA (adenine2503-C2)-methyltransferase
MSRSAAALGPLGLTPEEWGAELSASGARAFHGRQIFRWIHARGVLEAERMTDLSKGLRQSVARLEPERTYSVASELRSSDGTRKLFVRLRDGATV